MADATAKGKRIFWLMILAVALFSLAPSLVLVNKLKAYYAFLTGWNPGTLKAAQTSFTPRHGEDEEMPDIHFVEFQLQAPEAEEVFLSASFNGWKSGRLALEKQHGQRWQIVMPLPPGKYYYGFEVDGRWRLDPQASGKENRNGREVSVITVP